ncbi:GD11949 [Drosophila simulans]|uniref:GD11949 n=1 Tax=Drosophila simulans TaxID=7240 RepID=B4NTJ7_DROSI|nr:GD11949 [Drosophila simulans]
MLRKLRSDLSLSELGEIPRTQQGEPLLEVERTGRGYDSRGAPQLREDVRVLRRMLDGTQIASVLMRLNRWMVKVSHYPGRITDIEQRSARRLIEQTAVLDAFERDISIWNHKVFHRNPILAKEDASIKKFRLWFSQFYSSNSKLYSEATNIGW